MPFTCTLCAKSYARFPELEAHENSYDHQHKKRLKDMKALTRNPTSRVVQDRAERKRKEDTNVLGGNTQEVDWRETATRMDKAEPTGPAKGFGGVVAGTDTLGDGDKEVDREAQGRMVADNEKEEEWIICERTMPWEELGSLQDMLDLDTRRPGEMQRFVDREKAHLAIRRDDAWHKELWKGIGEKQTPIQPVDNQHESASESGSPPRALGLGY
ncbi:hypothetical protein K461DRAFT_115555 [Myriangium duriaei CBS 260.36]|uniref:C2H2-type domain-containing protein n=1 Tax=Myriangium duriaei CBS 260.36 TaxID=1168546 RepID=A0A9P4J1H1_9PEZI|nr:hypothetical protein K461DRAFT_115555 [Myriangium duriaei CBS 260.36]